LGGFGAGAMGWDAEESERYRTLSDSLGKVAETIARGDSDGALRNLLLDMSASYKKLAGHFRAREETAHLRCEPGAIKETEEDRHASLAVRVIYVKLQEQWAALAAALDKDASPGESE